MNKQTIASLFIGVIMLTSVAGFALSGRVITQQPHNQQNQIEIPFVSNRSYTPAEKTALLRQGRLIVEEVYTTTCASCPQIDQELRTFVQKYSGFVFLSSVVTDGDGEFQTLQMLSPTGQIIPLDPLNITQESLSSLFCEVSYVKPRDCLLQTIIVQQPQTVANATEETAPVENSTVTEPLDDVVDERENSTV